MSSSNINKMQAQQKPRFSVAINTKGYQNLINNTLGDPNRSKRFIASITSAVAVNPELQKCDAGTILAGALLGESLNLSPSPQLGQYYLVPFKSKAKVGRNGEILQPESIKAQFVLGYKGYIQLAIRSGQYKKLNVIEIKANELKRFDPLNETIECTLIENFEERAAAPTIGYYAMFEYTNGFRKAIYWSKEKMLSHADTYSAAFRKDSYLKIQNNEIPEEDMWKYSSFWYKSFDDMAKKTLLRQLISKWGVMNAEIQMAFERDNTVNVFDDNNGITGEVIDMDPFEKQEIITPKVKNVEEEINLNEL